MGKELFVGMGITIVALLLIAGLVKGASSLINKEIVDLGDGKYSVIETYEKEQIIDIKILNQEKQRVQIDLDALGDQTTFVDACKVSCEQECIYKYNENKERLQAKLDYYQEQIDLLNKEKIVSIQK